MPARLGFIAVSALVLSAACRPTNNPAAQTINLPYPSTTPVQVTLEIGNGTLAVSPNDVPAVTGEITTNVDAWKPVIDASADHIRIAQGEITPGRVIPNASNMWDIRLGRGTPLVLNVSQGEASANLDLGGLWLEELIIQGTTGALNLHYASPHPAEDGGVASISLTGGAVSGDSLLNSHLSRLQIVTTSGNQVLEFDGQELVQDMRVNIETRTGNVRLNIPGRVPAQVVYRTNSGVVQTVDPLFETVNEGVFEIGGYRDAEGPRLLVEVQTVIGDLHLLGI